MIDLAAVLDERPLVLAIAGPNGAGKTTFYRAFLARTGLVFVNTDQIASATGLDAYAAAELAEAYRQKLVEQKESFIFETVFSDPVGEKLKFLLQLEESGYTVVLIFIGIASPAQSSTRVSMRVAQGGHDVPADKIAARFVRTLKNLQLSLPQLQNVLVYDHTDLNSGYVLVAQKWRGILSAATVAPPWLRPLLSVK
jgi:predicted ABC-type ATPase